MHEDHPVQFTQGHAKKLDDIHHALIGNAELGTAGLAARVRDVESKVESHDRKFWLFTLIGSALWATLVAFKENIFGRH